MMKSKNLGWAIFMAMYWRRGQVFSHRGLALKRDPFLPTIIEVLKKQNVQA